jgi:hypothetical protein
MPLKIKKEECGGEILKSGYHLILSFRSIFLIWFLVSALLWMKMMRRSVAMQIGNNEREQRRKKRKRKYFFKKLKPRKEESERKREKGRGIDNHQKHV